MTRTKRIYNKPINITHLYMGDTWCWSIYRFPGWHHPYKQLTNARHQFRWYFKHCKDTPRYWRKRLKSYIRMEVKHLLVEDYEPELEPYLTYCYWLPYMSE